MPDNTPHDMPHYPELTAAAKTWRWIPPENCLQQRNILVTGANAGIGLTAAKTFASYGANVILLGRNRPGLEQVFDWIGEYTQTQATIVPCDLEGLEDANSQALAQAIEGDYGELHGLLHNASFLGAKVPISHYPTSDWQRAFRVNVQSAMMLTRDLLPLLQLPTKACITFTSSSVGRLGRAYWGAYAASKFATEGLMQTLADELADISQISVQSINPGGTRTAMRAAAYPAENPNDVPPAEAHMDLYLNLFANCPSSQHGKALDARALDEDIWDSN